MNNLNDQEQASYTADPSAVDLSVIIETYKALLAGNNLPERVAVQTVVLQTLLYAAETKLAQYENQVPVGYVGSEFLNSLKIERFASIATYMEKYKSDKFSQPLYASPAPVAETGFAATITEVIKEESLGGAACGWKSCTGCLEAEDGHHCGTYPYSETFKTHVGAGCVECGGIGVVWEYYSKSILDDMQHPIQPQPDTNSHACQSKTIGDLIHKAIDECGVNSFASKMKEKLAVKRLQGRCGWQDMLDRELSAILRQCVEKGDPVDVANLCMMLSENGLSIFPAEPIEQWQDISTVGEGDYGRLIMVGAYDAKGRWCAAVRGTKQFIAMLNNPKDGTLKNSMHLKWAPTHFMQLIAPLRKAGGINGER